MSLTGKLVSQIEIKSSGDAFYELFRHKPHQLSAIIPAQIQNCELHEGDWGAPGSILFFYYTHDGKECASKERVEATVDEEKKSVSLIKILEGDLLKLYKNFSTTLDVEALQGERSLVTWTIEYEKLNENIPDPNALMDFHLSLTKDVEAYHLR